MLVDKGNPNTDPGVTVTPTKRKFKYKMLEKEVKSQWIMGKWKVWVVAWLLFSCKLWRVWFVGFEGRVESWLESVGKMVVRVKVACLSGCWNPWKCMFVSFPLIPPGNTPDKSLGTFRRLRSLRMRFRNLWKFWLQPVEYPVTSVLRFPTITKNYHFKHSFIWCNNLAKNEPRGVLDSESEL